MSTTDSSTGMSDMEEKKNFLRVVTALNSEGKKCLRRLLDNYLKHHDNNLLDYYKSIKEERREKFEYLIEPSVIKNFDITDLHAALRYVHDKNTTWEGWGEGESDEMFKAATNIKNMRNRLFHLPSENLKYDDFKDIMDKLKENIIKLGGEAQVVDDFRNEQFGSPIVIQAFLEIVHDSKKYFEQEERHDRYIQESVDVSQSFPSGIQSLNISALEVMQNSSITFSTTPRNVNISRMRIDRESRANFANELVQPHTKISVQRQEQVAKYGGAQASSSDQTTESRM
ncbi:uncharacterized protein LOC117113115 [Anneissia japonica]|uniref:uncharacterized protein LOC117113115 n=1 Tax=Anneissia japonica TaxID=1529436 RepID=UPI0014257448|nr:uncharacterized protein LOC117113115 [Anneissia japonica]XP_033112250.1 uncharacterized protein LOC117113115 [Anneissia japonica]XP_033112251.1 uncharacterized protein LOC117113115 [Anneissia japonica]